jgi:sarcosine oxidase, subunit beta
MRHSDVLIIGAGITGLATALALAEEGVSVSVVDAYGPAAMASGWTLAGVRQSGRDPAELELAREAVAMWADLDARLGAPTGYRRSGNLRLARNEAEAEVIRTLVETQASAGLDIVLIQGAELRSFAPALSDGIVCASFCASDGQAEPDATAQAYVTASTRLGVQIRSGVRVHGFDIEGGRFRAIETGQGRISADACLIATGIGTPPLLETLGLSLPLRTPLVAVAQTEPVAHFLTPVLGVANADLAARQQQDGRLRVTSGLEPWSGELLHDERGQPVARPSAGTISAMLRRVAQVLPALETAPLARFWGGVIDLTPDGLPVIDRAPGIAGLFVAAGFSGHGFGIGPAVGQALGDLILGRRSRFAMEAFRFDRFGEGQGEAAALTLHG